MYQFDIDGQFILMADDYGDITVCERGGTFNGFYIGPGGPNLGIYSNNDYIFTANVDGHFQIRQKFRENVNFSTTQPGSNHLILSAFDNRENIDSAELTFTVVVPTPNVTIISPENGTTYNGTFISLNWAHNVPAVAWAGYSLNGADNVTFPSIFPPTLVGVLDPTSEAFDIYSDNSYVYAADRANKRINVFDRNNLSLITSLSNGASFSFGVIADSKFIYEANHDCKIHIYNKVGFTLNTTLNDGVGGINCAMQSVHVDDGYIYGGWQNNKVFVWNKTTRLQVANLSMESELSFSIKSDRDYIYATDVNASFFGGIRIFNRTNFSEVDFLLGDEVGVMNEIAIDNDYIYGAKNGVGLAQGYIYIWDRTDFSRVEKLDESKGNIKGLHVDSTFIYGTGSFDAPNRHDLLMWDKSDINNIFVAHVLEDPNNTLADVFVDSSYIYAGLSGSGYGGIYTYDSITPIDNFNATEGNNTFVIYINDTFGNTDSTSVSFVVDTELIFNFIAIEEDLDGAIIQFQLLNNNLPPGNFNWSLDFGDSTAINNTQSIFLRTFEDIFVIAEHNYSSAGQYNLTATSTNGVIQDAKTLTVNIV